MTIGVLGRTHEAFLARLVDHLAQQLASVEVPQILDDHNARKTSEAGPHTCVPGHVAPCPLSNDSHALDPPQATQNLIWKEQS